MSRLWTPPMMMPGHLWMDGLIFILVILTDSSVWHIHIFSLPDIALAVGTFIYSCYFNLLHLSY